MLAAAAKAGCAHAERGKQGNEEHETGRAILPFE